MVKVFRHKDIHEDVLTEIIGIKSIFWKYSYDEHAKWMLDNLLSDDLHFLVYEDGEIIAYLNLVQVQLTINQKDYDVLGIGNVCTKYRGKGHGSVLMKAVNEYLKENQFTGLLFCKEALKAFYLQYDWEVVFNKFTSNDVLMMVYNCQHDGKTFAYNDRNF